MIKPVLLVFGILISMPLAQGKAPSPPNVEQILARYEKAIGGKAAFAQVRTMVFRGTIEFPSNGLSGTTAEYFKAPDHFLAVTDIPGYGTSHTVYDGKSAWTENSKQGLREITGPALADMRRRAKIQWPVMLKVLYPGLKLKGHESIEGKEAWVLEANQDDWIFHFCFDANTGLMVRFDTNTGEPDSSSTVLIGDYRPVGQVQFSFAATKVTTKVVWSRKLTDVKFDVPIDDDLFLRTIKAVDK